MSLPFHKKIFINLAIFATTIVLAVTGVIYLEQLQSARTLVKQTYHSTAVQLAEEISLYLKVYDIPSVERVLSQSYVTRNSNCVFVRDATGDTIYERSKVALSNRLECGDYMGSVEIKYADNVIGILEYYYNLSYTFVVPFPWMLIAILTLLISGLTAIFYLAYQYHTRHILEFLLLVDQIDTKHPSFPDHPASESREPLISSLYGKMARLLERLNRVTSDLKNREKDKALGEIAAQVAHDIRSPLAALDVVVQHTAELPEDTRLMIRSAVSRIRDIANGLLEKNRGLQRAGDKAEAAPDSRESAGIYLISSLIDPLVTEKRMQFRSRIGIEIDASLDVSSYGLFAKIAPTEFKRVISNLINNSVEALGERGAVSISLSGSDKNIAITVQDNGKGIPPEIVAKLGIRGETHGKAGGSGLGLYHARSSVESWGGKLEIASEIGKGTSVAVTLPRAKPPDWFVSELKLEPSSTVVIADDDASIHQIWSGRFESIRAKEKGIELLHFSTSEEVIKWANDSGSQGRKVIYLIDHEFIGDQRTGLDVIEHLNLGRKAILVTSRFEEKAILDGCRKLGVRLIPKGMAGFVPISITPAAADKDSPDLVLIDDDDSIHITWRFSAKRNGKTIRAYSRPDDFFAEEKYFNRSLPIYVDANLGDDIHGDEVAKQIFDLGFTDVYLATGYQAKEFSHLTFLKGIQGKDPPW